MPYVPIVDLMQCDSYINVQEMYTKEQWVELSKVLDERILSQIDKKFTYQPPSSAYPDGMKVIKPRFNK